MNTIEELGTCITSKMINGIPLKNLANILSVYDGTDWQKYIKIDPSVPYCKNRVYLNDHIEIVIITWNQSQSSKIHDHPANG